MEKIVITGTGAISAIGNTASEVWTNMLEGKPGMGPLTKFDPGDHLVKIACQVKDFDPETVLDRREVRRRDPYQHFAATAVKQALDESGLTLTPENESKVGVVIASGVGGIETLEENIIAVHEEGPRKVNAFMIPMLMANGASGLVGIDHGFRGPAFAVASACASGQDGIGMAWMMLRSGVIDVAIAGAAEAPITPTAVAAFDRIQAMSRRTAEDATPSPFSLERDGLVVGEGAGIIVIERESHAKARGANILAELAGYSATADAFHITAPSDTGEGGARAMRQALELAEINLEDVDYINAHGTGTPLNDKSETLGIKSAFGEHAYNLAVSSTKSMTGHMMGATGALETVVLVNAVRDGKIPPTINYQTPDPELDLDYVPNEARDAKVDVAISNAFGFGGHNAVIVVKKYN
jgi:beta-ketoacyl-acyl-carrier-protein synthase II